VTFANARSQQAAPRIRVSAAIAVDERVLLLEQQRGGERYWLLPGGGVRFAEDLATALRRELLEELDLAATIGRPIALAESISPDMGVYAKHVLHVVLTAAVDASLLDSRAIRGATERSSPTTTTWRDPVVLDVRLFAAAELAALDIRPPIADFLAAFLQEEPEGVVYLGRRW